MKEYVKRVNAGNYPVTVVLHYGKNSETAKFDTIERAIALVNTVLDQGAPLKSYEIHVTL